ncbi:MAG: hypothetical protein AAFV53_35475 [Myxococcota bacterium]
MGMIEAAQVVPPIEADTFKSAGQRWVTAGRSDVLRSASTGRSYQPPFPENRWICPVMVTRSIAFVSSERAGSWRASPG